VNPRVGMDKCGKFPPSPPEFDPRTVQPIASRYTEYATRSINEDGISYSSHLINIGSTALGGHWPTETNVGSDLYPGHPPANFYNPVSLRLPLPRQSILISVGAFSLTSRFVHNCPTHLILLHQHCHT
jgi:hypothetical protein